MSETYLQQAFGQPTFTDVHANGNSSGRDLFDILDAANLHHNHEYDPSGQHLHSLHIQSQDVIAQTQQFAYALHSSGVSAPGLPYTSEAPAMPTMTGHIPQHYEHDSALQIGFDDLQGFSPVTQSFNINAYRTPYPDSIATSTSSATSPERTNASLLTDPVVVEAEEDKRKRNQAASARFRQKKKQREQQLMETSQKMQDRTKKLEAENDGLKKENMFLKKLLVEKVDHMSDEDRELLKKAAEGALAGVIGKKS
ncbi:uncharacterized protein J4E78_004027 [Alternaria triticimaculans]|uniref:uncharacterized protein n=1 Tax=Alternaria triticimaculans TaxID=297637 RepID=UPI0020C49AB6|nr:uncharacterized protein J4E78_004027 [Alternaria triticimaculans]KAI4663611.1 hypothetical protein J4E78_004027 [Alternaria triticimaculans]